MHCSNKRWQDLKKRLILPSIKIINEISDIYITMEYEKIGRKIIDLVFFIDSKEKRENVLTIDTEKEVLYKDLLRAGIIV